MDMLLATTLRILMRRQEWHNYDTIVSEDLFTNTTARALYALIGEAHNTSTRDVSITKLKLAIKAGMPKKRQQTLLDAVDDLKEVPDADLDDTENIVRKYAARHMAYKASLYIGTHMGDATFDYSIPAKYCSQARDYAQNKLQARVEIREAGLPGDTDMVRNPIPLGLSAQLDDHLMGGVAAGELLLFLGPPERGKTSYLYRVAANAALAGESVLAFSLEIAQYKGWLRFDQCLTGLTNTELLGARRLVKSRRAKLSGNFWLMNYSSQPLTPSVVLAEGEAMLNAGIPLTYIMIDYIEIMHLSVGYGRKKYEALSDLVVEIRRVANTLNVPIVSAWQIKRDGAHKDTFTTADISDCWDAVKHADILLGLNQSPLEMENGVMRIKLLKQREDPARPMIWLDSDMRRMVIKSYQRGKEASDETRLMVGRDRPRTAVHRSSAAKK